MSMNFTIFGAGVLGSILGAHLTRAGHSVVMIARGRRAQEIEEHGLRIRGLAEFATPVRVVEDTVGLSGKGTLIVAIKTPGTREALAGLAPIHPEQVLSLQNGVQKNALLADVFGRGATLGALADTSGELLSSGEVLFTRNVNLLLGELAGGLSERAAGIAKAIDDSGVRSTAVPDIVSLEWSKFVAWAGLMMLAVVTQAETWKYLNDPDVARLLVRVMREMGGLAKAEGVAITDRSMVPAATILDSSDEAALTLVAQASRDYKTKAPNHRMSALQDLQAHRPLEIHETVGTALANAHARGIAMPVTESLYLAVGALDRLGRAD